MCRSLTGSSTPQSTGGAWPGFATFWPMPTLGWTTPFCGRNRSGGSAQLKGLNIRYFFFLGDPQRDLSVSAFNGFLVLPVRWFHAPQASIKKLNAETLRTRGGSPRKETPLCSKITSGATHLNGYNELRHLIEVDTECHFQGAMLWALRTPWPAMISNFRRTSRCGSSTRPKPPRSSAVRPSARPAGARASFAPSAGPAGTAASPGACSKAKTAVTILRRPCLRSKHG